MVNDNTIFYLDAVEEQSLKIYNRNFEDEQIEVSQTVSEPSKKKHKKGWVITSPKDGRVLASSEQTKR